MYVVLQRGKISLENFKDSIKQLEKKVENGHPAIAVRTVFGNRLKELASAMKEVITESHASYDIHMQTVIDSAFEVYSSVRLFKEKGIDVSELLPHYEVAIRYALSNSDLLNYSNRTTQMDKFMKTPIFDKISIKELSSLQFNSDFVTWKENFRRILERVDFMGKVLRNVNFIEFETFKRILSSYFGTIFDIEEIVKNLDFNFYIQNIETLEYDPSSFLLVEIYELFGLQVYTAYLTVERFKAANFKNVLDWITVDEWNQYTLLRDVSTRFNSFHQLVQEQMVGLSSHPDLRSVIHGEHPLIERYLLLIKYVRFFLNLTEILKRVVVNPTPADRRELENLSQQIESIVDRNIFRSNEEAPVLLDQKFQVLLTRTLILSNFALAVYYESSPNRLDNLSENIWKRFSEFPIDYNNFDVYLVRPVIYALLGTKLQKHEYLSHCVELLKSMEDVISNAPPYLRLSYWFFSYMILLISQDVPFMDSRNGIYQIFFEENLFIPNKNLVNEFETYLSYIDAYEKAISENTLKPSLPMEIQFRNLSLSEGNFYRHFKTIEAYWLTNKYIELQVPVFGSPSDCIYL